MGVDGTHSRMNPSVLTCVSNRLYLGSAGAAAPATMQPMLEPAGGVATPGAHPTCVSPNDTTADGDHPLLRIKPSVLTCVSPNDTPR